MVRINWLSSAKIDLKEIHDYIALDSKRYARFQIEKIVESTKILSTHPEIGKVVPEMQISNIRQIIEGNYRIIYRIKNKEQIDILMVHHVFRDFKFRIKDY